MMRQKFIHPLWVHIPAVTVLIGAIAFRLLTGKADNEDIVTFGVVGILYVGISILGDELWARQESRKTFNWLSLLDEIAVGLIAAPFLGRTAWGIVACAVIAAIFFEVIRPYKPFEQHFIPEDTSILEREIGMKTEQGEAWSYSDVQNPGWLNWVLIAAILAMTIGAISVFHESPLESVKMLCIASLIVVFLGGMQTSVTPDRVEVRIGVLGIRLLRLRVASIESAEVHTFSPLAEFGGYGIRMNLRMKAYYWRGNRGVLLRTNEGKKYLIGSDHPERLASVIQVAMRYAG
jgi:hypothetical protein